MRTNANAFAPPWTHTASWPHCRTSIERAWATWAWSSTIAMDAVALIQTTLDSEGCGHLGRPEAVAELRTAGMRFLSGMSKTLLPPAFRPPPPQQQQQQAELDTGDLAV